LISYYGKFTITNLQYNDSLADVKSISYKGLSAKVRTQVCVCVNKISVNQFRMHLGVY